MQYSDLGDVTLFTKDNEERLAKARTGLCSVASEFISERAVHVLPPEVVAILSTLVANEDMNGLHVCIRSQAEHFACKPGNWDFWDLVDAISSYNDALTTYWPYMQLSGRERHLRWTETYLKEQARAKARAA